MSAETSPLYQVVVESGRDRGRVFAIPAAGARVGRDKQNDVALPDPLLSRHHCRFEMHGGELWVVDLASANQTHVNDKAVEESRLQPGDTVRVGDTVMRISRLAAAAQQPPIDLGLDRGRESPAGRHNLRPLLWTVAGICVLTIGTVLIWQYFFGNKGAPESRPVADAQDFSLQIRYEKVEADPTSVFRYEMALAPNGILAVRIDDLNPKRDNHPRKEGRIKDDERIRELAREILASGFFQLDSSYAGINPQAGALNSWDLTIAVGRKVHRCRVENRLEPEVFRAVRERLETFSKNELGIWAIQFSRDKLVELAAETFRVGRKSYDERDIQYGNLCQAIKKFKEAAFYLQTVEPKPEYYPEIADAQRRAVEDLDRRYQDQNFRADRAINMAEWQNAARELRILRDLIPDRDDDRYKDATRKLIDVEQHLKARK